jgi:RNA polymerase sigma factor (sigma-70 family)
MCNSSNHPPSAPALSRDGPYRQQPDEALVAACLSGESGAWDALIARYQGFIYSLALRHGLSPADADDLFQDVCLKLFHRLEELREVRRLSGWLGAIVRQEVWRRWRRNQASPWSELSEDAAALMSADAVDPEGALLALEREQLVRHGLEALSDECRRLLTLLYGPDEVSYAEAAERLSMPVGSVGPRRGRCLERLRKKLEEQGF